MKLTVKKQRQKLTKRALLIVVISLVFDLAVPKAIHADGEFVFIEPITQQVYTSGTRNYLPEAKDREPRLVMELPISAYNSLVGQTDNSPCIAARGFNLCEHNQEDVIATNFLPMGAQVGIPELFGDRVFTVVDRMNARYYYNIDIWMREYEDAKAFGFKYATVEVF